MAPTRSGIVTNSKKKHLGVLSEKKSPVVNSRKNSTVRLDKRNLKCEYCGHSPRYSSIAALKKHIIEAHAAARRCPICNEVFNLNVSYFTMYRHFSRKHHEKYTWEKILKLQKEGFICCICLDSFPSAISLYTHRRRCHEENSNGTTFECICGEKFRTKLTLRLHINTCKG